MLVSKDTKNDDFEFMRDKWRSFARKNRKTNVRVKFEFFETSTIKNKTLEFPQSMVTIR